MKKIYKTLFCSGLLLCVHLVTHVSRAQTADWIWASAPSSFSNNKGNDIATDASGNIYVTGLFRGSLDFGTATLTSNGGSDVFVAKYSPAGSLLWARSAGGSTANMESAEGVAIDKNGEIFITGYFHTSITFGGITLTNAGNEDMFLVKYDSSGTVLWARQSIGVDYDRGHGVAVDGSGNAYVTGFFKSVTLGFGQSGPTLNNGRFEDVYIVKFSGSGTALWAQAATGRNEDIPNAIAVDGADNVYITGTFNSASLDFGPDSLTSINEPYVFVAKYSGTGTFIWAKKGVAANAAWGNDIATDGQGNIYVTGEFDGSSITFSPKSVYIVNNNENVYLVKFDPNGSVLWAKGAGGVDIEGAHGVAADGDGNAYITGYFATDGLAFGQNFLPVNNPPTQNIFIAKYNPSGNVIWAKSTDGDYEDGGTAVAEDGKGNVYLTGYFGSQSVSFGTTVLQTPAFSTTFISKLSGGYVGIKEAVAGKHSDVFPNPCNGIFQVSAPGEGEWGIRIYSILGECLYEATTTNAYSMIDLSARPKGIYFYHVTTGTMIAVGKVVIE